MPNIGPGGFTTDDFKSSGPSVVVEGLAEFKAALAEIDSETKWAKEIAVTHRELARDVAAKATQRARSMGGQQAHFAEALAGRGTTRAARIEVAGKTTPKGKAKANPAFWGRKSQGNWIGTSWDVGGPGGPYAINDTIRTEDQFIIEAYGKAVDRLTRTAF